MKILPKPLRVLADFYEMTDDLLQVAAEESEDIREPVAQPLPVHAWLEKKSEKQRLLLLEKLLHDDSGVVRVDTLLTIRKTLKSFPWPSRTTMRTMDDLCRLATERSDKQRRQ